MNNSLYFVYAPFSVCMLWNEKLIPIKFDIFIVKIMLNN